MSEKCDQDTLHALKIAFSYMPNAIEVTQYEYGGNYQRVLEHIELLKEILRFNDTDPDEVYGEINPSDSPNSCY